MILSLSCLSRNASCKRCIKVASNALTASNANYQQELIACATIANTGAGMLSGISQKGSVRSRTYCFTEFCNSQCLSQFAASFIVVGTETSIAECCAEKRIAVVQIPITHQIKRKERARQRGTARPRPALPPPPCPWARHQREDPACA